MNYTVDYGNYTNMPGYWIEVSKAKEVYEARHYNTQKDFENGLKDICSKYGIKYKKPKYKDGLHTTQTCIPDYQDQYTQWKESKNKNRLEYGKELIGEYVTLYKKGLISKEEYSLYLTAIQKQLFDI